MTDSTASAPPTRAAVEPTFVRLLRHPTGAVSLLVTAIVVVLAVIGPWLAPMDPNTSSITELLDPPSETHLLGTDSSGRDVLSRLLVATQITLAAAMVALVTALVIGVAAGLIAGYYRGWLDAVASWVTSLVMALPGVVVLLAARTVLGPSVWVAMAIFGVLLSPAYYRLVHATVSAVREELYVDAARVSGLSDARIIGRHILSVVRAPIIVQSAIIAGMAITIQSGLEFLGIGDMSSPTWGSMLNDGFSSIYSEPLLMLWPSLAIALTCIALSLLANSLRDVLERTPATRGRRKASREPSAAVTAPEEDPYAPIIHADESRAEPVLSISGLRVAYAQPNGDEREVVHGVALDVLKGEVHGLIGESGSGKSQTAFSVLGLLPRGGRVSAGTIHYEGVDLAGASERTYAGVRGARIGYVPQEPMSNLDPAFTIGYQLIEPLRTHMGLTRKEATARALSLLERVGIPDPQRTFNAYPFEVSGGMAQRVLIAGAVSTDPDLIIADEPTTALDVTVQAEVLALLRDLQKERQMAMLLVTHNFGVVADICDRVTVMEQGRFVEQGSVRTILGSPAHPYTRSLLDAILDGGPVRPAYGSEGVRP